MSQRLRQYFFAPVAAIRPYLVEKSVLMLLALDLWVLRLGPANRYDREELNLAHFGWLNAVAPTPTTGLYVGVAVLAGILAIAIAVAELGRVWRVALVVLYSYSWAMSRLDSFQHHYLLSWVLLCVALFPPLSTAELFASRQTARPSRGSSRLPRASAWAWVLLGCVVAVVYVFTAVTKIDPVWQSGACLKQLQGTASMMRPIESAFAGLGISNSSFWPLVAFWTVIVELALAAAYLLAPIADRSTNRGLRAVVFASWIIAVALHIGFEIAGLKIGWFSTYMILLASAYLLPERWLWPVGKLWARCMVILDFGTARRAPIIPIAIAASTIAVGYWADLPGVFPACIVAAACVFAIRTHRRALAAVAIAVVALALILQFGDARSQFYPYRLAQLQRRGQFAAARAMIPKAERYVNANDLFGQNNLAWFYAVAGDDSLRDGAKAVKYATRSCQLCGYANASALDTLACAQATDGDFSQALETVRRAKDLLGRSDAGELSAMLKEHEQLFSERRPYVEASKYRYHAPQP